MYNRAFTCDMTFKQNTLFPFWFRKKNSQDPPFRFMAFGISIAGRVVRNFPVYHNSIDFNFEVLHVLCSIVFI